MSLAAPGRPLKRYLENLLPTLADVHAYIIEDEYLIAQALRDMLEDLGFTKFSFARSEDVAVLGANEPGIDLITADVRLLPGDGVRAVEEICSKRDVPVLFITGYREELEERKPDAVALQKPIKQGEARRGRTSGGPQHWGADRAAIAIMIKCRTTGSIYAQRKVAVAIT